MICQGLAQTSKTFAFSNLVKPCNAGKLKCHYVVYIPMALLFLFLNNTFILLNSAVLQNELIMNMPISEYKFLFGAEDMEIDQKHAAAISMKLKYPVTVTTNYSLDHYLTEEADRIAIENRLMQWYFFNELLDEEPAQQTQLPTLTRPDVKIKGEVLLGLYQDVFGPEQMFDLPPYHPSMIIQDLPFDPIDHFKSQL